jgi:CheY-like chemotaxis protein
MDEVEKNIEKNIAIVHDFNAILPINEDAKSDLSPVLRNGSNDNDFNNYNNNNNNNTSIYNNSNNNNNNYNSNNSSMQNMISTTNSNNTLTFPDVTSTRSTNNIFNSIYNTNNNTNNNNNKSQLSILSDNALMQQQRAMRLSIASPSMGGIKVLVVEDCASQRKILVRRLNLADPTWEVSIAVSGEDALQKLNTARKIFDVVFIDENLSLSDGLYGHELVYIMREQFKMHRCVIVACVGNPAKVQGDLIQAGVDFVWSKPPPAPAEIKLKIDFLLSLKCKAFAVQY